MELSKLVTSQWYTVSNMDDTAGLMLYRNDTIESIKEQIDESEKKAIEQGYSPTEWLIVLNKTNTIFKTDMNGNDKRFHYRSTTQEAIGIYENGTITFFDGRPSI